MIKRNSINSEVHNSPAANATGLSILQQPKGNNIYNPGLQHLPIQRNASAGSVNDSPANRTDSMADTMTGIRKINFIQRKCRHCEDEEAQRKPLTSFIQKKEADEKDTANNIVSDQIHSTKGFGTALPDRTKSFMESRFGTDFSSVRVHSGEYASQLSNELNAQAFTVGNDIYFNKGKFSPESTSGKHLLAHELTHTIQQGNHADNTNIQRMIEVDKGLQLDTMGFNANKSGNFYTAPKIVKSTLFNEIFTSMLKSERIFKIVGKSNASVNANLQKHIGARAGVIDFASKKKYSFGAGVGFKMNSTYWNVGTGEAGYETKPGVDRQKAIEDLNVHPDQYAIACLAATTLTEEGGGQSPIVYDDGGGDTDWVPGDWGYIKNTKFPAGGRVGLEGENIIYTGKDKFWGHFGPGVEYKTLAGWFAEVKGWNGEALITESRKFPSAGLEE